MEPGIATRATTVIQPVSPLAPLTAGKELVVAAPEGERVEGEAKAEKAEVAPKDVVTAKRLRKILSNLDFDSDRVSTVRSLAPQIVDKLSAAEVISEVMDHSSSAAEAIAALNGQAYVAEPGRALITKPTLGDRFSSALEGLTYPWREFIGSAFISVLGAYAFQAVGIHLGSIPYLNAIALASGTTGDGADVLAALTGVVASGMVIGAVRGFAEPTRVKSDEG